MGAFPCARDDIYFEPPEVSLSAELRRDRGSVFLSGGGLGFSKAAQNDRLPGGE
jgi:hypothetical protein